MSTVGYVTAILDFVRGKLWAREASNFCDFWKITSCNFTASQCTAIWLVESTIANLYQNMHFDALDFSDCRPEEVISFFWRSVYLIPNWIATPCSWSLEKFSMPRLSIRSTWLVSWYLVRPSLTIYCIISPNNLIYSWNYDKILINH